MLPQMHDRLAHYALTAAANAIVEKVDHVQAASSEASG